MTAKIAARPMDDPRVRALVAELQRETASFHTQKALLRETAARRARLAAELHDAGLSYARLGQALGVHRSGIHQTVSRVRGTAKESAR
jgi:hypothetical protein